MAISTYIKIGLVGSMLSSLYRAVVASSVALDFYGEDADAIPETEREIISKHTMNAIRYFCMLVLMRWWTKDTKAFEATGEVVEGAAGGKNEMVRQNSGVLVGGDEDGGSAVMVNGSKTEEVLGAGYLGDCQRQCWKGDVSQPLMGTVVKDIKEK